MKESIKQGLIAAVAGILFCIALTIVMLEVQNILKMNRTVNGSGGAVTEKEVSDYEGNRGNTTDW